jgi:polyhydroxybutyrate depolymerase
MQAYRLACELADRIVAVGVQSASLELDGCTPAQPVSLVHIHGTADQNVPINGGIGANAISGVSYRPPMYGATTFAAINGCGDRTRDSIDPANADVSTRTWRPCRDETEVRFITVAGAAHAWMGSRVVVRRRGNSTYPKLDSSAVIWSFLINHPRR